MFFIFKLSLLSPPPSFVWCRLPLAPSGWCFLVCSSSWMVLPSSPPPPLGGAAFPSPLVGFPFLFVPEYFCVFLSTKCLTTTEEGRKQHHPKEKEEAGSTTQKEGRRRQHHPRGAEEGGVETAAPPEKGGRDKVKWWSTLHLWGGGAGCLSLGGAAFSFLPFRWCCFPSLRVGSPFLFVLVYFVLFLSRKCFTTTDKEDEGKQHHPREGRRRQHHPRGATSTTPTKEEGKRAPYKRREEKPAAQEKGARQSKVVVHLGRWCQLPILGGAAFSSLLLGGAGCTSRVVLPSASAVDLPRNQ